MRRKPSRLSWPRRATEYSNASISATMSRSSTRFTSLTKGQPRPAGTRGRDRASRKQEADAQPPGARPHGGGRARRGALDQERASNRALGLWSFFVYSRGFTSALYLSGRRIRTARIDMIRRQPDEPRVLRLLLVYLVDAVQADEFGHHDLAQVSSCFRLVYVPCGISMFE